MKSSIDFRNPLKLLLMYRFIEAYISRHTDSPSYKDLVEAGFASSASVVSYYYRVMGKLKMLTLTPHRPRSVHLLPLDKAHPFMMHLSEYDWVQITAREFLDNHFEGVALIGQYEWACLGATGEKVHFMRAAAFQDHPAVEKIHAYVSADRLIHWRKNIDRETGQLTDCFSPRYSVPETVVEEDES